MADGKAKIIIETNDKEACKGISNTSEMLGQMSTQIKNNNSVIGESAQKWATYSQSIYATIGIIKDFSTAAKTAFDYLREGAGFQ